MKKPAFITALCCCVLSPSLVAQIGGDGTDGVFHPTANTVLDTSARPNGFNYKSITIPKGVIVALVGTHPAILRSQGAVTIAGMLHADGYASVGSAGGLPGAGGYAGGAGGLGSGRSGQGPGGGIGGIAFMGQRGYGQNGDHAPPGWGRTYGSAWPFDLRGGSGGGGSATPWSWQVPPGPGGTGGGGTIVILADGAVNVTGEVSSLGGGTRVYVSQGQGASGSIMIRSLVDVTISGTVDAASKQSFAFTSGGGFVRVDAYGKIPTITGTVVPVPKRLWMPMLREATPLTIGQTWRIEAGAVPGDDVFFYASPKFAHIALPGLGILQLDPVALIPLGTAKVPTTGHEPVAALTLLVPYIPALRGIWVFVQAINPTTKLAAGPKLSNHLAVQVQ